MIATPVIIVNYKTYENGYNVNAIKLTEVLQKMVEETEANVLVNNYTLDSGLLFKEGVLYTFVQNIDLSFFELIESSISVSKTRPMLLECIVDMVKAISPDCWIIYISCKRNSRKEIKILRFGTDDILQALGVLNYTSKYIQKGVAS
ncbi:MAG: hypothetical protein A7315_05225 [Candidatus Altiarchaeales archaeon WOR_SM1_79]|nr:MAG: hypothetical protein A7315_05225 [Candidatus Altiarchaeales archaeon WOR_SM1_79]